MMKLYRTIRTALKALWRNPMRALLTTLGIVIGIAAVIAMMEIGEGSSAALQKSIASMGANVLLIFPGSMSNTGVNQGSGSNVTLTPQDCQAIAKEAPSVSAIAPVVRARTQIVYGNRNWVPNSMYGTTPEWLKIRDWLNLSEGEPFTDRDVLSGACVCLLGQTIVRELFQNQSVVGKEIRINNVPFRVVGALASKGANMMGMDQDDVVVAPWTVIKYRISGSALAVSNQSKAATSSAASSVSNPFPGDAPALYPDQSSVQAQDNPMLIRFANVDMLISSARSAEEIQSAIKEMTSVLRRQHHLRAGQDNDFDIRDTRELTDTLSSMTKMMTHLLLAVATISLIVGGVGIMNIMLVSVTERTREIGLRMAVGARSRDILRQFLIEAVVLCLAGGALGILLGHGGAYLVTTLLNWPVQTSPAAIIAAVLVSFAVGIVFGFYPAWKAARLDPIEALRYE